MIFFKEPLLFSCNIAKRYQSATFKVSVDAIEYGNVRIVRQLPLHHFLKEDQNEQVHPFHPSHLSLAALALAVATATGSAIAADGIANTSATVIVPIAISKVTDLSFGSFARGAGGTVTLSTDGNRALSGVVASGSDGPTVAQFNVTGDASKNFSVSVSVTKALTRNGGTETMTFVPISTLTPTAETSATASGGILDAGGAKIYVGGVLTVGASQAGGVYAGEITATVDYGV